MKTPYNPKEVGFRNGSASGVYHDAALKRCESTERIPFPLALSDRQLQA